MDALRPLKAAQKSGLSSRSNALPSAQRQRQARQLGRAEDAAQSGSALTMWWNDSAGTTTTAGQGGAKGEGEAVARVGGRLPAARSRARAAAGVGRRRAAAASKAADAWGGDWFGSVLGTVKSTAAGLGRGRRPATRADVGDLGGMAASCAAGGLRRRRSSGAPAGAGTASSAGARPRPTPPSRRGRRPRRP